MMIRSQMVPAYILRIQRKDEKKMQNEFVCFHSVEI